MAEGVLGMSATIADIVVVMPTFDRKIANAEHYFQYTIESLWRSGMNRSSRYASFLVADGSGVARPTISRILGAFGFSGVSIYDSATQLLPCENAGRALSLGALTGAPWVLYLEDDIDVCADFLDSVGAWLDDHADASHRLYAFGAAYTPQIEAEIARGHSSWEYPVHAFYGTQAIAMRAEDARSLGEYWQANPKVRGVSAPGQYDLIAQDWLRARYVDGRILASAPSFVQHTGRQSSIRPEDANPPVFDSWRGREWRYVSRSRVILVP